MTWTKLSDDFTDDTWTLSDAAFRLHVDGLVWSNRKLLDCKLPKDDLRRFKTPQAVQELVAGGWWKDAGDHFLIVHHALYQRARDAVINQQNANRANRAKRGLGTPAGREVVSAPAFSNDSLNDSSNEWENERDRTGRGRDIANKSEANSEQVNLQTGEVVEFSGQGEMQDTCRVCGRPLGWAVVREFAICSLSDKKHEVARVA